MKQLSVYCVHVTAWDGLVMNGVDIQVAVPKGAPDAMVSAAVTEAVKLAPERVAVSKIERLEIGSVKHVCDALLAEEVPF